MVEKIPKVKESEFGTGRVGKLHAVTQKWNVPKPKELL